MGNMLDYIKSGIPISYMLNLRMHSVVSYIRGFVVKLLISDCGLFLKVGRNTRLKCKNKMKFGNRVRIGKCCEMDALSTDGISIKNSSSIADYSIIRCTGSLKNLGVGITIGENTHFGEYLFCGAAGGIVIGNNTIGGQNIRFHSENHIFSDLNRLIIDQGVSHKGISIGDNCWIGAGAVFCDGAKIGNGCIVAANAVVTKQFPDNCVLGGVPARILYYREKQI